MRVRVRFGTFGFTEPRTLDHSDFRPTTEIFVVINLMGPVRVRVKDPRTVGPSDFKPETKIFVVTQMLWVLIFGCVCLILILLRAVAPSQLIPIIY